MTAHRLAIVLFVLPLTGAAGAQTPVRDAVRTLLAHPATGTAVLAGVVMSDEAESRPIPRATVMIGDNASMSGGRLTVTDDDGRFRFSGLPAGRYLVGAYKPGFVPAAYGARRPMRLGESVTGTAIVVQEGQQLANLVLRMMRGAVITGTIHGTDGLPARGIRVGLFQSRPMPPAGVRMLAAVRTVEVDDATDGRGIYRIFGLPPGEYFVAAFPGTAANLELTRDVDLVRAESLRTGTPTGVGGLRAAAAPPAVEPRPAVGFAPVFYPGSTSAAGAAPVLLRASEVRAGMDIQLQLVPNSRVEGTAQAPDGRPAAGVSLWLYPLTGPAELRMDWGFSGGIVTDAAGTFSIKGVPPGSYFLRATTRANAAGPGTPSLWGFADVSVQGDDVRVNVTLELGIRVAGRVIFEAASQQPPQDLTRVRIALLADQTRFATVNLPYATIDPSGEFSFSSVPAGRYRLTASITGPAQDAWMLRGAQLNGQDALDGMVEVQQGSAAAAAVVTFTDRITELSGRMVDGSSNPAPEYVLIMFPANPAAWSWQSRRIQQTRPAHDGGFVFRHLPPGEYLLAAVTDVAQDEWYDPAFLDTLVTSALKITLAEGERKTQDVRVR